MQIASFTEEANFNENKITTKVVLESSFSKEIRILMKKGQVMKAHKAPFPIVVHVLEGEIDFGVEDKIHALKKGAILTVEGNIVHDLKAREDSIVRLTLSKLDRAERVAKIAQDSINN